MAELAKAFGQRVRALRAERGFSQSELAERAGMSEEWVRRIERGEGAPSFTSLEALSEALDAPVSELFAEAPASDAERFARAVEGLGEDAVQWLIRGARLLRR